MRKAILVGNLLVAISLAMAVLVSSFTASDVLDLRGFSFNWTSTYVIKAPYRFWWGELIDPSHIQKGAAPHATDVVMMPKYWTEYSLDERPLPTKGIATYFIFQQLSQQGQLIRSIFNFSNNGQNIRNI